MEDNAPHGPVYVALGTNLLPSSPARRWLAARTRLQDAVNALTAAGFPTLAASRLWRSRSWPDPAEPAFYNACIGIDPGSAGPQAVMAALLRIEAAFGRVRGERNAPRTLDLDLIDFGGRVGDAPEGPGGPALSLPHPRLSERAFVLGPLSDIAPHWRHPQTGLGVATLLPAAQALWPARPLKARLGSGPIIVSAMVGGPLAGR